MILFSHRAKIEALFVMWVRLTEPRMALCAMNFVGFLLETDCGQRFVRKMADEINNRSVDKCLKQP